MDLQNGRVLGGRFEVLGVLGRGGMATVYLAVDRVRGERVALKVLHDHLGAQPAMIERLRREVRAAGRIRHPHALVAYDLQELDGHFALVMPLHAGRTLAEAVEADGPLAAAELISLAKVLAEALSEAHRRGVLHRDVTPQNVMVDREGVGSLTDFGLARVDDQRSATGTTALGTAGYAAPEVYSGERSDPRSDLYGLGATLYFAASGAAPFGGGNPMGVLQRQLAGDFVPTRAARSDLPAWFAETVDGLLARDVEARPSGAGALVASLDAAEAPESLVLGRGAAEPLAVVGLPPGPWTVTIENPEVRRARPRRGPARPDDWGARFARVVEVVAHQVGEQVEDMLGITPPASVEARLTAAVARLAGLPEDALTPPPELGEPRCRLVEGVDRETAETLAQAARMAGASCEVEKAAADRRASGWPSVGIWAPVVALLVACSFAVAQGAPSWLFAAFIPLGLVLRASGAGEANLPLAFRQDLRPYLTQRYAHLAPSLAPISGRTDGTRRPSDRGGGHLPPDPDRDGVGAVERLARRVSGDLAALERSIEAHRDDLAAVVVADLRETVGALTARTAQIAEVARDLSEEIRSEGASNDDGAQTRLEARLERLLTWRAAGQAVDGAEIEALSRALDVVREAGQRAADLDAQMTRATADLLEIGAAVARARRVLCDPVSVGASAERLAGRLQGQADAAAATLAELRSGPLPRRDEAGGAEMVRGVAFARRESER